MSTHKVEVVRVGPVTKIENSDFLATTQIWGYTAIVRLGDILEGDLAVYVEPDYVIPTAEENAEAAARFSFLGDKRRIKAKRLRGVWSQGLLVKAWGDMKEGDDVMELLSIVRYEPEMGKIGTDGNSESPHATLAPLWKYGIENLRRNHTELQPGEWVYVSEKLHGASAKYAFRDNRMWVGSHARWVKAPGTYERDDGTTYEAPKTIWWSALEQNPWIEEWCRANPTMTLFGEVFGQVQDLKYDAKPGQLFFRAFDILQQNLAWMNAPDFIKALPQEHRVPEVYCGPYDFKLIEEMSRMDSKIAKHLAEGVVVKPAVERRSHAGRIALKFVSDRYMERA